MLAQTRREVLGGIVLLAGSAAYLNGALHYRLGSAMRMGPGYFPVLLGIAGTLIAVAIIFHAVLPGRAAAAEDAAEDETLSLRPLIAVSASVAVFAATVQWLGLIPAVAGCVVAAAAGDSASTVRGTVLLAAALSTGCWLAFSYLLGLPVPAFVDLAR